MSYAAKYDEHHNRYCVDSDAAAVVTNTITRISVQVLKAACKTLDTNGEWKLREIGSTVKTLAPPLQTTCRYWSYFKGAIIKTSCRENSNLRCCPLYRNDCAPYRIEACVSAGTGVAG